MSALVPIWILGGPFIGLVILSFAFKGPSVMGGGTRLGRDHDTLRNPSPLLDPMAPGAPRRNL